MDRNRRYYCAEMDFNRVVETLSQIVPSFHEPPPPRLGDVRLPMIFYLETIVGIILLLTVCVWLSRDPLPWPFTRGRAEILRKQRDDGQELTDEEQDIVDRDSENMAW